MADEEHQPLNQDANNAAAGGGGGGAAVAGPLDQPKAFSGGYKAVQMPFLSCLRTNLCCKMGYNVGMIAKVPLRRESMPLHYGPRADSYSLGVRIEGIEHLTSELINLIRPMVRVHVVHIEHGTYLRSAKRTFAAPLTTASYPLKDAADCPRWQQDLVIDINYGDIVSEDALILFELLDNRPSLNVKKTARNQGLRPPKQIAWGYLRPVSTSGHLNVGLRDDWLAPPPKAVGGSNRGKNRKKKTSASAGGGAAGSGSEVESDGDGRRTTSRSRSRRRRASSDESDRDRDRDGDAADDDEEDEDDDAGGEHPDSDEPDSNRRRRAKKGPPPAAAAASVPGVVEQLPQSIQLYSYRLSDGWLGAVQRRMMGWPSLKIAMDPKTRSEVTHYPDGVPAVYLQWRMQRRSPIRFGALSVAIGPRSTLYVTPHAYPVGQGIAAAAASSGVLKPEGSDHGTPASNKGLNRAASAMSVGADAPVAVPAHVKLGITKAEWKQIKTAAARRGRGPKEPCVLPTRLLHRLDVGPDGAMVVAFSHCGHLLAVAAKSPHAPSPFTPECAASPHPGCTYSLRLYDADAGALVWAEPYAHHGVIYDLKWSKDDSYIVTASADGSSKVWDVLPLYPNWHAHRNALMGAAAAADDDDDDRATRTPRPGLASPASGTGLAAYPGHARLLHTLTASPPVFTYSVLFQEYVVPDSSALPLHGFTAGGAAAPGSPKHLSVSDLLAGQKQRGSVQPASLQRTPPPPVIAGGADGKLRVWDGGRFVGKIKVDKDRSEGGAAETDEDLAPHDGRVNALAIDERTRYLFSSDSAGEIFVWRLDAQSKYELLRKFKRDTPAAAVPSSLGGAGGALSVTGSFAGTNFFGGGGGGLRRGDSFARGQSVESTPRMGPLGGFGATQTLTASYASAAAAAALPENNADGKHGGAAGAAGVISMVMHPDKYKTQMLALSAEPTALRVYNTSTYKVQSVCAGGAAAGGTSCPPTDAASSVRGFGSAVFCRAALSADGRIAVSGTTNPNDGGCSRLRFWDSQSGTVMPCPLTDLLLPYTVRSIAWHPKQHVMAVAMVGPGATVALYCGQRESAERAVARINQTSIAAFYATVVGGDSAVPSTKNPLLDSPVSTKDKGVRLDSPVARARAGRGETPTSAADKENKSKE